MGFGYFVGYLGMVLILERFYSFFRLGVNGRFYYFGYITLISW